MIRRDYILRMLEEFLQVLSRIRALESGQLWNEAYSTLDAEFIRLTGLGAEAVARLSETELMARLIQGEPTQAVREKTWILTALLKEAGDIAAGQHREVQSRASYLKGLHWLLGVLARAEVSDFPEFVPRVEGFVAALEDSVLPLPSLALLMQHYERIGEFAKAEDCLFSMLEAQPHNSELIDFGLGFYRRLAARPDTDLAAGNLPRAELEASRAELAQRSTPSPTPPTVPPG